MASEPSETEIQAIGILWNTENPGATGEIPPADRDRLLARVRVNQAVAEAEALRMLHCKMREERWYPRRHQLVALAAILLLLGSGLIVSLALSFFQTHS